MTTDVTALAAFVAGVFSISSPCILPLIPLYLAHLTGTSVTEARQQERGRLLVHAAAYCLGFSTIFVAIGLALGAASSWAVSAELIAANRGWIARAGGALLILLGLHQIGLIQIPGLSRERRVSAVAWSSRGVLSSFAIGATFGAGWTPCVGPILGAIMTMAAGQGDANRAAVLLLLYSAGMSIPFLAFAAAFGSAQRLIRVLRGRLEMVRSLSGAVMTAAGAIMLLGIYQGFFAELVSQGRWTPWEPSL
jgi:cytochrome c-type biogenesis protein